MIQPCLREWAQRQAASPPGASREHSLACSANSESSFKYLLQSHQLPVFYLPLLFAPVTLGTLTHLFIKSLIQQTQMSINAPYMPGTQLETGDPATSEPQLTPESSQSRWGGKGLSSPQSEGHSPLPRTDTGAPGISRARADQRRVLSSLLTRPTPQSD